nr:hypothetical protein L203_06586 [Cryptococcus depauperatus CBS 7841]
MSPRSPSCYHQPSEIKSLSAKFFSTYFKPKRYVKEPQSPSLAWSKLPPPAAEIDERPSARIRRFKLWGHIAPELRVAVLDPRRRGKIAAFLARYRSFAIPPLSQPEHGLLVRSHRPFQQQPKPFLRILTAPPPLSSNERPQIPKLPKKEKKKRHEQLLEHKWVLDQEHERRFRKGMSIMMGQVLEFQETNSLTVDGKLEWDENVDAGKVLTYRDFFKAIRKDSSAIFSYFSPTEIAPVPGREEARAQVKAEEIRKKNKKKRKERRQAQKEAETQALKNKEIAASISQPPPEKTNPKEVPTKSEDLEHESLQSPHPPVQQDLKVPPSPLSPEKASNIMKIDQTQNDDMDISGLVQHLLGLEQERMKLLKEIDESNSWRFTLLTKQLEDSDLMELIQGKRLQDGTTSSHTTQEFSTLKTSRSKIRPGSFNIDDDTAVASLPTPTSPNSIVSGLASGSNTTHDSETDFISDNNGFEDHCKKQRMLMSQGEQSRMYGTLENGEMLSTLADRLAFV